MTRDEYIKRRKKGEGENSSLSSSSSAYDRYALKKTAGVFENAYTRGSDALNNIYGGWNSPEDFERNKQIALESARAMNEAKNQYGVDSYDEIMNLYNKNLEGLDSVGEMYSHYVNEKGYNKAMKTYELGQKYKGASYEDIQKAIEEATDSDEILFLRKYTDYSSLEDFDKDIAAREAKVQEYEANHKNKLIDKRIDELKNKKSRLEAATKYDKYADLANNEDFAQYSDPTQILNAELGQDVDFYLNNKDIFDRGILSGQYNAVRLGDMNEDMQKMGAYIFNTQGKEAYLEYMREMTDYVRNEQAQATSELWSGYAEEHPVLATIGSATLQPAVGGLAGIEQLLDIANGHTSASSLTGLSSAMSGATSQISQNLKDNYGYLPSFAYDVFATGVPNRLGQMLFGSGYNVVMGLQSFADTYASEINNGTPAGTALLNALVTGGIETLTEQIGMEWAFGESKGAIKTVLKQAFAEGSEEVVGSLANLIYDINANGGESEYRQNVRNYVEMGYSIEEARKKASLDFIKDVAHQFAVAAFSTAPTTGVQQIARVRNESRMGEYIDREKLKGIGSEELSKKYGEEWSQKASNREVYNAYDKYVTDTKTKATETEKSESVKALMSEYDMSEEEATKYVEALYDGKNTKILKTHFGSVIKEEADNGTGWASKVNTTESSKYVDKISEAADMVMSEDQVKANKAQKKLKVGEKNTVKGEEAEIISMKATKDGYVVKTSKGEVDSQDVTVTADKAKALSYSAEITNEALKEAYVHYYQGEDIYDYDQYVRTAYEAGVESLDLSEFPTIIDGLGKAKAMAFYNLGAEKTLREELATEEALDKVIKTYKSKFSTGKFTSGAFVDGKFKEDKDIFRNLNRTQKKLYKVVEAFSNLSGINVRVFADRSAASKNGEFVADSKGGWISINLAARPYGDSAYGINKYVVSTLSHELTHWMKANNREAYDILENAIVESLTEKGTLEKHIKTEQDNYKKSEGKELSREVALEEVVARACEDMLNSTETMSEVLSHTDLNGLEKLKAAFEKWFEHIKEFFNELMSGFTSPNEITQSLSKEYEDIRKLWVKGINDAINMKRSGQQTSQKAKTAKKNSIKLSEREIKALDTLNVEVEGSYAYPKFNLKTFRESDYNKNIDIAAAALAKRMEISVEEAKKYIKDVGSIANIISKNQDRLDYEAIEGKSAWVSNPEYGGSLDYSFLCPKRLTYTGTMNAILKKQNDLIFSVDDFLWLRKALITAGYEAPCSFCFVESARARFGKYNQQFLDIAKAEKLAYIPTAEELTNPDKLEELREKHPETYNRYEKFLNGLSQRKPKMLEERRAYNGDILKAFQGKEDTIADKNMHGGIRFNSFSDFEIVHMLDCMQAIMDMSRVGLAGFGYTKQKAFAQIFGKTGLKINMSCVAKGIEADGKHIIFDDVEGMNHEDALKLRSGNVGIVCVVFNDAQLKAALCDERIDYVLPFHRSQWSKKDYEKMGLSLDTKDYTKPQTEKLGTKKAKEGNIPFLSYWNENQTGVETVQRYLDLINEQGKTPIFPMVLEKVDGKWTMPKGIKKNGKFINKTEEIKEKAAENYWKLLTEFKLYDNDGTPIGQSAVKPNFDMKAARALLKSYEGSHKEFPVAQNVVDDFLEYKKTGETKNFEWKRNSNKMDSEGKALTEDQVKYFKDSKVVDKNGNLKVMYHGTDKGGFTVFDPSQSDDDLSLFFSDNPEVSKTYIKYGWSRIFNPTKPETEEIKTTEAAKKYLESIGYKNINSYDDKAYGRTNTYWSFTLPNGQRIYGAYTSKNFIELAEAQRKSKSLLYPVYLNVTNPYVFDAKGNNWSSLNGLDYEDEGYQLIDLTIEQYDEDEYEVSSFEMDYDETISFDSIVRQFGEDIAETVQKYGGLEYRNILFHPDMKEVIPNDTRTAAMYAYYHGYDGVMINNVIDNGSQSTQGASNIAVVFKPNQIKSIYNEHPTENEDIRYSSKMDSAGRTLTADQEKFFKDSKARDDEGNLLALYHGTTEPGFTVFKEDAPIYLAANRYVARSFAWDGKAFNAKTGEGSIYECYANVVNPLVVDATRTALKGKMNVDITYDRNAGRYDIKFTDQEGKTYNYTTYRLEEAFDAKTKAQIENYYESHNNPKYRINGKNVDIKKPSPFWDIMYNGESMSTDTIAKIAREQGHDGVIIKNVVEGTSGFQEGTTDVIVFKAEQIKDVSNEHPTKDKDIRYSNKVDSQGSSLTEEQVKYFKKSKVRDDQGRLLKMYHGVGKGGTFNVFDRNKSDDKLSFFFTDNKKVASTYQGGLVGALNALLDEAVYDVPDSFKLENGKLVYSRDDIQESNKVYFATEDEAIAFLADQIGEEVEYIQEDIEWMRKEKPVSEIKEVYLNVVNPLVIDAKGGYWNELSVDREEIGNTRDIAQMAFRRGHDGVIIKNVIDNASMDTIPSTVVIAFDSNQIKDVANKKPTSNEDTRKSEKMSYDELSDEAKDRIRELEEEVGRLSDENTALRAEKNMEKVRAEKKVMVDRITEQAKVLSRWLLTNDKQNPVPQSVRIPLGKFLTSIDFTKDSYEWRKSHGLLSKSDESLGTRMSKISQMLLELDQDKSTDKDAYDMSQLDWIPEFSTEFAKIKDTIATVESKEGERFHLGKMNHEDLQTLLNLITALKTSIINMNKCLSAHNKMSVEGVGKEVISYLDRIGQKNGGINWLEISNTTPYYFFQRLGKGGEQAFRLLMDGMSDYAFKAKQIEDFAKETFKGEDVKKWRDEVKTFEVEEVEVKTDRKEGEMPLEKKSRTIQMTVPQIMSLYCLQKRDQAMNHIKSGGIRVGSFETRADGKKVKVRQIENVTLTEKDLKNILSTLTDEQKDVADKLQKFMNTVCQKWGNEVTMKRFGYKGMTEKDYFPINVDRNQLSSEARQKGSSLYQMLNMGFTKPINPNAKNPIEIFDIFETFTIHATEMAQYNTLALPVLDVIKIWNYRDQELLDEEENKAHWHSVKGSIESALGEKANGYIGRLLADLNGDVTGGRADALGKKLMKNYKTAAVAANLQVAALQPLSYTRAGYMIDPKYLTKGLAMKSDKEKTLKYCGIAQWKEMGFYNTSISTGLEHRIMQDDSKKDKVIEKTLFLAGKMDEWTWGKLWNACLLETRDKYPTLEGEDLYKKVGERLTEVIYGTQVVDSVLTRSDVMRDRTLYSQMVTAFQAEPTLSLNILMDATIKFDQEKRASGTQAALRMHGDKIKRAALVYLTSSALESILRAVIGKIRNYDGDEDDETLIEDFFKRFIEELNPLRKIPLVKDIVDILVSAISKGKIYTDTRLDEAVFENVGKSIIRIQRLINGGEWNYKAINEIAKGIDATGLPASSTIRILKVFWNNTIGRVWPSTNIK